MDQIIDILDHAMHNNYIPVGNLAILNKIKKNKLTKDKIVLNLIDAMLEKKIVNGKLRTEIKDVIKKLKDDDNNVIKTNKKKVIKKKIEDSESIDSESIDFENDSDLTDIIISDKYVGYDRIVVVNDDLLENELDMACHRYNKFTKNNPAEGISYNTTKKHYTLRSPDIKETSSKDLEKLVVKLKNEGLHKYSDRFLKNVDNIKIMYKNKKIVVYIHKNELCYDLNHVINLFDELIYKNEKYDQYKSKIIYYQIKDNEYGGFYIKEFINEKTFYDIILHSNSVFSISFKNDLSDLLVDLRNKGLLTIENDTLKINDRKLDKKVKSKELTNIDHFDKPCEYTQTYDNFVLTNLVHEHIEKFKKVNLNKYHKKALMYFCIMTIADPLELNRIICKVGYTCNIVKRMSSLKSEYKCKCYLLALKRIENENNEKEFHDLLKMKYSDLVVNTKIGNMDKTELYVFDKNLYEEFLSYEDKIKSSDVDIQLDKDAEMIIKEYFNVSDDFDQYVTNYKYMLSKCDNNYALVDAKNNYFSQKMRFEHEERMKDKEICIERDKIKYAYDAEKIKYETKKMECDVELKKIELEILKLNMANGMLKKKTDEFPHITLGKHKK